jgi:hypothetical protein
MARRFFNACRIEQLLPLAKLIAAPQSTGTCGLEAMSRRTHRHPLLGAARSPAPS